MYSMAVEAVEADLSSLVTIGGGPMTPKDSTNAFRMLQHFQAFTALSFGNKQCQAAISTIVAMKAWDNASLMHMVLAVSSSHLK